MSKQASILAVLAAALLTVASSASEGAFPIQVPAPAPMPPGGPGHPVVTASAFPIPAPAPVPPTGPTGPVVIA